MFLTPWQWNYLIRHARNAEHAGQLVTFALQWPVLNQNRQLTAGPASLDRAAAAEQFERLVRDLTACTCTYGLHPTIWSPTHTVDVIGVGRRGAAYTFRINPLCPHHGDGNRIIRTVKLSDGRIKLAPGEWDEIRRWQTTLTDEETHDADPG